MVYNKPGKLDATFAALSDPTRRAILATLAERDAMTVSDIARPFPVSLPAVLKHLDVLAGAGLISRSKAGRVVTCELTAAPLEEAMQWLTRYAQFWSSQLDRLATFLEEDPCQAPAPTHSQARVSPSNVTCARRPKKSTPPGRIRKRS